MFDIGFFELVIVFIIGLLVLGPERLPQVVRSIGLWTGRARATLNNLKHEMEREAYNEDMKENFRKQMQELGLDEKIIEQADLQDKPAKQQAATPELSSDVKKKDE
jgi:sec-independent protein translocase protein TatB